MILTDGVHLVSDVGFIELHQFAIRMRLKPAWFQGSHRVPHYDISGKVAQRVIEHGDVEVVSRRELVRRAVRPWRGIIVCR